MKQFVVSYSIREGRTGRVLRESTGNVVTATTVDVAIKRLLAGGHAAGWRFATVHQGHRIKLQRGQTIVITAALR